MKTLTSILAAAIALAAGAFGSAGPEPVIDRSKLDALHRAGQSFEEALARPETPTETLGQLRQRIEMEAERVEGRLSNGQERYIYDLYSTAAAEYAACLARYQSHGSKERFQSELAPVKGYLRLADEAYGGRPQRPLPAAGAPAPLATSSTTPPQPPASAEAGREPAPQPPAPPSPEIVPPPPVRHEPPTRVEMTPTQLRKAADRVRVVKKSDGLASCEAVAEIDLPGKDREGAYEIGGRNFFYQDLVGLARLKTVEAGGDTFLLEKKSREGLVGRAYRCGR